MSVTNKRYASTPVLSCLYCHSCISCLYCFPGCPKIPILHCSKCGHGHLHRWTRKKTSQQFQKLHSQVTSSYVFVASLNFHSYLLFVIFLHRQNFWRIKLTPEKRVNYYKIHSKLPIFCVITAKYTVNCQFFALNL